MWCAEVRSLKAAKEVWANCVGSRCPVRTTTNRFLGFEINSPGTRPKGEKEEEATQITNLWFYNLQVADLNPTRREVGYLKLDTNWSLSFSSLRTPHAAPKASRHPTSMLIITLHGRQTEFGPHEKLFATAELLDLPYYG